MDTAHGQTTTGQTTGQHDAGPDLVLTRSEERLRVDVARRPYERVRVRRTVVTETVTQTVQVRREELHVERERIDDPAGETDLGDLAGAGAGEPGVLEVVLREERPVTSLVVVPVERVRVVTEVVRGEQVVTADVRSERIDVDGAGVPASAAGTSRA